MADKWPPTKEAELATYVTSFSAKLTAGATSLGLTAADATAFATASTNFVNAYNLAADPATRTAATVANKDVTKATVLALLRVDAKRIQANPAVTAEQKADLGLPIHNASPAPRPAPSTRPVLTLVGRGSLSQTIQIVDETTPTRKAKPFGTSGVEIFAWLDEGPAPTDLREWTFIGLATKSQYQITYDAAQDGKMISVAARWYNSKAEVGPLSAPLVARVAA